MKDTKITPITQVSNRISLLDFFRGTALLMMTIFHFAWDLEFFHFIDTGTTAQASWKLLARLTASGFLIIAGFSFMLAHQRGINWRGFWYRLRLITSAAFIITTATYIATPSSFIFFGILHQIAFSSIIALFFLNRSSPLIFITSIIIIALPYLFRSDFFSYSIFWWSGLAPIYPTSNDYVPMFPWTGYMLLGLGLAKTTALQKFNHIKVENTAIGRFLCFLGRYSLVYYLVHQPVLVTVMWVLTLILPYFTLI
jgi:uncharacterized membrane protein